VPHAPASVLLRQGSPLSDDKSSVTMFLVANPAGLATFYNPSAFQTALDAAAAASGQPLRPRLKCIHMPSECALPAFILPPCFRRAATRSPSQALDITASLTMPSPLPPHLTAVPLLYDWQEGVYTDGSCLPLPSGNVLGAAFFDGHTGTTCTIQPNGVGSTYTVLRAELSAISLDRQPLFSPPHQKKSLFSFNSS
jgi:hypothetical protein